MPVDRQAPLAPMDSSYLWQLTVGRRPLGGWGGGGGSPRPKTRGVGPRASAEKNAPALVYQIPTISLWLR